MNTCTGTASPDGLCKNAAKTAQSIMIDVTNLPNIIRNEPTTYLQLRQGNKLVDLDGIFKETAINDDATDNDDDADNVNINIGQSSCSLYMAQSSIPNSGLGIYAGRDFTRGEIVDARPQAALPLIQMDDNESYSISALSNYPWTAILSGSHLEDVSSKGLIPNVGMLANSHLGLVNVKQTSYEGVQSIIGSSDRSKDGSAGAYSLYHHSSFNADINIEEGQELFVDYGENYFHDREMKFGLVFPTLQNYNDADQIVRDFMKSHPTTHMEDTELTEEIREEWSDIVAELKDGEDTDNIRVAYALPDAVEDLKHVARVGTARYSILGSSQSIDWLEENGFCLDHIRMGKSNIPYAGYGAFATRQMDKESVISPMPLLPIDRDILKIKPKIEEDDNTKSGHSTNKDQLLLNYCFGHPDSSLLFFPYGSSANFINHSEEPNAFIRWSSSDLSKSENLERSVKAVSTGLVMEVVAIVDIEVGVEITIDYGTSWSQAWKRHLEIWNTHYINGDDGANVMNPAHTAKLMNEGTTNTLIKTLLEQKENPYPDCIRTACYSSLLDSSLTDNSYAYRYTPHDVASLQFCEVVDRYRKGNGTWYDVKISNTLLTHLPSEGIRFVPGENCSDMHLSQAFRRESQVPDGLYPALWLDYANGDLNPQE